MQIHQSFLNIRLFSTLHAPSCVSPSAQSRQSKKKRQDKKVSTIAGGRKAKVIPVIVRCHPTTLCERSISKGKKGKKTRRNGIRSPGQPNFRFFHLTWMSAATLKIKDGPTFWTQKSGARSIN